jgi:hypothetical protein
MKPYGTNGDHEASPKETPATKQIRKRWKKQLKAKERREICYKSEIGYSGTHQRENVI